MTADNAPSITGVMININFAGSWLWLALALGVAAVVAIAARQPTRNRWARSSRRPRRNQSRPAENPGLRSGTVTSRRPRRP